MRSRCVSHWRCKLFSCRLHVYSSAAFTRLKRVELCNKGRVTAVVERVMQGAGIVPRDRTDGPRQQQGSPVHSWSSPECVYSSVTATMQSPANVIISFTRTSCPKACINHCRPDYHQTCNCCSSSSGRYTSVLFDVIRSFINQSSAPSLLNYSPCGWPVQDSAVRGVGGVVTRQAASNWRRWWRQKELESRQNVTWRHGGTVRARNVNAGGRCASVHFTCDSEMIKVCCQRALLTEWDGHDYARLHIPQISHNSDIYGTSSSASFDM